MDKITPINDKGGLEKLAKYLDSLGKEMQICSSIPKETQQQLNYHRNKDPKTKATIKLLKELEDETT